MSLSIPFDNDNNAGTATASFERLRRLFSGGGRSRHWTFSLASHVECRDLTPRIPEFFYSPVSQPRDGKIFLERGQFQIWLIHPQQFQE
ncbi:MAG: hypothetical protein KCHDKBKB_01175 [Elusimicrobia bacterium]|nr:hypothetical protein [Elusimicrobiota bacterium]